VKPARSITVAFSGLDGAGKTSQARALREAVEALGSDAVLEWAPAWQLNLRFVANPVRRLLRLGPRSDAPPGLGNPDLRPAHDPTVVAHGWAVIQAFAIALSLWRARLRHALRGRVVVLDRQGLDFAVFLVYRHGGGRRLMPEVRLLRALAPRPSLAFLLDISAEIARARKPEQFSVDELRVQAELYRRLAPGFGAERLDGELPAEQVSAAVAERVWRRLGAR
jgi:thymidylate kinase